ncbi:PRC-barrel domain-containing protein [Alteromonas sp. D210916BOD_24]|uniref:PRC-barrel domain-containing protein n=1 Tax=Alteromonas sp. D210916BOD_24 TaxID=3157618 RepID=UPI00399CBBBD
MIVTSKQLTHFSIRATDDSIGGIRDILFDDETYVVRYLVADTNTWFPLSRKVVISPISVKHLDIDEGNVHINMTVDTLKNSPSIDEHKPVSREYEENLFKYFGYGYYWIGPGAWGEFAHPNELVELQRQEESGLQHPKKTENHLRACSEVGGYEVATQNDKVGHISNFIIDTYSWKIVLLVVDTNNWLPGGKHLALLPSDIKKIDWAAHHVAVSLTHEKLEDRPEVDSDRLGEVGYIDELFTAIEG